MSSEFIFDLVLVQKCVKNYSWALFEKLLFQDTSIFAVFSIFNLSRSKQKIFRNFFLSLFLEFWALQTLKVSSKSVTTSVWSGWVHMEIPSIIFFDFRFHYRSFLLPIAILVNVILRIHVSRYVTANKHTYTCIDLFYFIDKLLL